MPIYHYECFKCCHALETLHDSTETLLQCPSCEKESLIRLVGLSKKLEKKKQEAKKLRAQREKKERGGPLGYTYYCLNKKCNNKEENLVYHEIDKKPRVRCKQCKKQMQRGLSKRAGNMRVQFKGWWPDKRRKEVKDRFHRQEEKARSRNINVDKLRGWAKRKSKKTISPYLSDPSIDGKRTPHDPDPSTGHFHHELEM